MKAFFDLLPVILFFIVYKTHDIYTATAVLMGAMTLQIIGIWLLKKKVERMFLFIWLTVIILGTLSLALHDDKFIMWKPTIVNWVLAIVFLGSQFIGEKSLVHRMMGEHLDMPEPLWKKTNIAWVTFFFLCGALNLAVAHHTGWTSEENDLWMNFKLFGLTGLSFAFMLGLIFTLRNYVRPMDEEEGKEKKQEVNNTP